MTIHGLTIREGATAPRMAERTTLRLGGPVLAEIDLRVPESAARVPEIALRLGGTPVCLGAGSNILAGDGLLPLVVVRDASPPSIETEEDGAGRVRVRASASVKLPALLARLAGMDLGGLEGLAGIPGLVGGAAAMNAGSFGQCVADAVESVSVATGEGFVKTFGRDEISFGYRHMDLPGLEGWRMILAATFILERKAPGEVAAAARAHMARKKATQPVGAACAGCVFTNPSPENPAGKLLEEAGFKGRRLGGMAFSAMHANFLINEGRGTSGQALELIAAAKNAVWEQRGIALEMEVKVWA